MLNNFYNDLTELINQKPDLKVISTMPASAPDESLSAVKPFSYNNLLSTSKAAQKGIKQYKIIPETRTLVIDDKKFHIKPWFNLKNALQGDFKTLDYIFSSLGFDINEFEIQILE